MAEMLGTLKGFVVSIQLHSEAVGRSQERRGSDRAESRGDAVSTVLDYFAEMAG